MSVRQPRHSAEETVRRGEEIYEKQIRPHVDAVNKGKYIAIDVETGAYEIGEDYSTLSKHLLLQKPDASLCILRIGYVAVGRMGGRVKVEHQ